MSTPPAPTLRYATLDLDQGSVCLALHAEGLRYVWWADSPNEAIQALRRLAPEANWVPDVRALAEPIAELQARLRGHVVGSSVCWAPHGTPFQQSVWRLLTEVPFGSTLSYRELARCLGKPGAERAVASACARNPLAIMVPCHRVVRADGQLAGYRWGIERKRWLLAREAASSGPRHG